MISPFAIEGPALVSFSGGRTSALMLRRILDEGLRPDVHVLFANTGKEREETLDFVEECSQRWGVPIHWLEYTQRNAEAAWREVTHATASRNGEPFELLIAKRKFLPNPVMRFCTTELKIRPMKGFALQLGWDHWANIVGLRADEPRRVAKMRQPTPQRWEVLLPLADAGITVADVGDFWAAQPFDLRLRPWEGNCDLCFLKSRLKRQRIMRDRPELAEWWIAREQEGAGRTSGSWFRSDVPPYSDLFRKVREQPLLPLNCAIDEIDDLGDCVCTD